MSTTKVCLVTGGARGIGLETVKTFLDYGWQVAMLDNNTETLAAARKALPGEVLCIDADVSKPDDVQRAVDQTAEHFGRLDGLVNNAGIADFGPIAQTSLEIWNAIMATNLTGPYLMVQAAAPVMLRSGGGAIVNIASISGHRASTLRTAYGTSKAGVIHLTKQQAAELGMDKFTTLTGVAAPLPIINIDTDMIIPKQFLKTIKRTGLGKSLFAEMRYDEDGNQTRTSCSTSRPTATRRSSSRATISAAARRASTRRGRCSTSASAA
jgi:NAD(P)-dependent dehydrogenase (short-subunit alcohol dehydrogenase family)